MELGLSGRTAVVTGAGRGIGLAVVRALAGEGMRVIAGSRQTTPDPDDLARRSAVTVAEADPSSLRAEDLDAVVDWVSRPGWLHTILSVYRAKALDAQQNAAHLAEPLPMPVLAVGGEAYLGDEVRRHMERAASDVRGVVLRGYGHTPSWEAPALLAAAYLDFFSTPGP